jgi:hypothetical protein
MIGDLDGTITALAVPFDSKRMPFDSKRLPPIVNTSFCWILRRSWQSTIALWISMVVSRQPWFP